MLDFYRTITKNLKPALETMLKLRLRGGKEISERINERKGLSEKSRPEGTLIWIHGASVGEAQSALILVDKLLSEDPTAHILITTGTTASARMISKKLPSRAFHQFYPWDYPEWVNRFLDKWHPDFVIWMESELWPNMLSEIKIRKIPAVLINARLSDKSFGRWNIFKKSAQEVISAFSMIMAQTEEDAVRYQKLGAKNAYATGNIKFSAKPLSYNDHEFGALAAHLRKPLWLFASTHAGEESMACRIHHKLKSDYPDIMTVIAPRHPERREEIERVISKAGLNVSFRGENKKPPANDADIYVADTMGEMGLFYRIAPVAVIGRSFSDDGGGGHNPIEPAQLRCAVLHGPHVQFQQAIYDEMNAANAAIKVANENALFESLKRLLADHEYLEARREAAFLFSKRKHEIADNIMDMLKPMMDKAA